MSEDYLHACQRAELLGEPTPNEEEWLASKKDIENEINEADNSEADLDQSDESMGRIGGGLDELNNILSVTQKKINRFKTVCGSLGQLLKGRMTPRANTPDNQQESTESNDENKDSDLRTNETCEDTTTLKASNNETEVQHQRDGDETKTLSSSKKHEMNNKIESHIDKLDSLITKAENAQYSMQHQTKQMKKIIKK